MIMIDGIIFTGMTYSSTISRPAGAVRIRTWLDKHNYNIEVVDYFDHFSNDEIEKICEKFIDKKTLFVGISLTFLTSFDKINFLFNLIKNKFPHVKTIIGGTEASINKIDINNVDRIIWGYAEEAILHYIEFLNGKRLDDLEWIPYNGSLAIDAEKKYKNDDSDLTIEWNDDDLIEINYLPIEISRGCIFRCKFCQYPLLGKKKNDYIRYENNLADEFRRNWEKWGINNYSFQDDTFNDNIVKLDHVANAIEKSGIKITYAAFLRADLLYTYPETISMLDNTGLIAGYFGIESLNHESKKAIGKGLDNEKQFEIIKELKKRRAIYTFTGMIIGLPFESIESVHKSQQWFFDQNGEIFNGWQWWPLGIRENVISRKSEFDRNFSKWGYTSMSINDDNDNGYLYWKNQYTNFEEACLLASKFNQETIKNNKNVWSIGVKNKTFELGEAGVILRSLGFTMDEIIDNKINADSLNESIEKIKTSIQRYKSLKLK